MVESVQNSRIFILDDGDTFAALGEELLAGFFDDETTKKPVVAPVAVQAIVPEVPAVVALPTAPAKAPEVLTSEVVPTVTSPLAVVPVETGEKLAQEALAVPAELTNEIVPVVEGEILEETASNIIASEIPAIAAVVTPAALVAEPTVAAVVAAPVKQTSEEEEGLIEGIVNTFIGEGELIKELIAVND